MSDSDEIYRRAKTALFVIVAGLVLFVAATGLLAYLVQDD